MARLKTLQTSPIDNREFSTQNEFCFEGIYIDYFTIFRI